MWSVILVILVAERSPVITEFPSMETCRVAVEAIGHQIDTARFNRSNYSMKCIPRTDAAQ